MWLYRFDAWTSKLHDIFAPITKSCLRMSYCMCTKSLHRDGEDMSFDISRLLIRLDVALPDSVTSFQGDYIDMLLGGFRLLLNNCHETPWDRPGLTPYAVRLPAMRYGATIVVSHVDIVCGS